MYLLCLLLVLISLPEKCPNTEFFLVRIFLYSARMQENAHQEKLRIWTLFTLRYYQVLLKKNWLNSDVVTYLLWFGIFYSISLIFVTQSIFAANLLVSIGWAKLTFLTNSSYTVFLTTTLSTALLCLLEIFSN